MRNAHKFRQARTSAPKDSQVSLLCRMILLFLYLLTTVHTSECLADELKPKVPEAAINCEDANLIDVFLCVDRVPLDAREVECLRRRYPSLPEVIALTGDPFNGTQCWACGGSAVAGTLVLKPVPCSPALPEWGICTSTAGGKCRKEYGLLIKNCLDSDGKAIVPQRAECVLTRKLLTECLDKCIDEIGQVLVR